MSLMKPGNAIFAPDPMVHIVSTAHSTRLQCPATSIPPEILSEILQLCRAQDPRDACWQEYPRPYNQVCGYWRRVIAASPLHWTNVLIHHDCCSTASEDTRTARRSLYIARVSHQLEHSQQVPLKVNVTDFAHIDEDTHPAVQILFEHHSRWKEATLSFTNPSLLNFAQQGDTWSFSELQRLVVTLADTQTSQASVSACRDVFLNAPKLKAVMLSADFGVFNFPWSQLRALALMHVDISLTDLQETFSQCTSLSELKLVSLKILDAFPDGTSFIVLSALTDLLLKGDQDSDHSFLLSRLRLPSLSRLLFLGDYPDPEHVKACIEASGNPELALLAFEEVSFSHLPHRHRHNAIPDVLALVPSVQYLRVNFGQDQMGDPEDGPRILETLLEHLDFSRDVSPSPYLGALDLENAPFTIGGPHQDSLIQIVRSRPTLGLIASKVQENIDHDPEEALRWLNLKAPPGLFIRMHVSLTRGAKVNEVFGAAQLEELARLSPLQSRLSLRLSDGPQTTPV